MDEELKSLLDNVGVCLHNLRVEMELDQRTAAKIAGTSQARISYLENGHSDVFVGTILKVAKAYNCSIELNFVPNELEEGVADDLVEAIFGVKPEEDVNLVRG